MQNIQAINVPIQVSADNGLSWETIVCISDHTLPVESTINKVNTQCGIAVGLGPVEFNPTGNGVTTTDENAGQVTTKTMIGWVVDQTPLLYRMQQSIGTGSIGNLLYLCGNCYMTKCDVTETVGDVEKFAFTLSGYGLPVLVPGTIPT